MQYSWTNKFSTCESIQRQLTLQLLQFCLHSLILALPLQGSQLTQLTTVVSGRKLTGKSINLGHQELNG